jgi:hypothetical protein
MLQLLYSPEDAEVQRGHKTVQSDSVIGLSQALIFLGLEIKPSALYVLRIQHTTE